MEIVSMSGRILSLGAAVALIGLLQPPAASAQQGERVAEGARLYGQTCTRCHNPRPPTERTDRDWTTVMGHMRTRANLSKSDTRAILTFLQATNRTEGENVASGRPTDGSSFLVDPGAAGRTPPSRAAGRAWSRQAIPTPAPVRKLGGLPVLEMLYPDLWIPLGSHEEPKSLAADGSSVP